MCLVYLRVTYKNATLGDNSYSIIITTFRTDLYPF
nr:MAG TPA: hypothetical protein [Caudoviricetes sp.]